MIESIILLKRNVFLRNEGNAGPLHRLLQEVEWSNFRSFLQALLERSLKPSSDPCRTYTRDEAGLHNPNSGRFIIEKDAKKGVPNNPRHLLDDHSGRLH